MTTREQWCRRTWLAGLSSRALRSMYIASTLVCSSVCVCVCCAWGWLPITKLYRHHTFGGQKIEWTERSLIDQENWVVISPPNSPTTPPSITTPPPLTHEHIHTNIHTHVHITDSRTWMEMAPPHPKKFFNVEPYSRTRIPGCRYGHTVCHRRGRIYMYGGRNDEDGSFSAVDCYDIGKWMLNAWQAVRTTQPHSRPLPA